MIEEDLENEKIHASNQTNFVQIDRKTFTKESIRNSLFSGTPVIVTNFKDIIHNDLIDKNLTQEISMNTIKSFVVIQLLSATESKINLQKSQSIKISSQVHIKNFLEKIKQEKMSQKFESLQLNQIFAKQDKKSSQQLTQQMNESWSIRIFPFHPNFIKIVKSIPRQIIPLSVHDILSYQKSQRLCYYTYIFGYKGYGESVEQKLQTEVYLNWGDSDIYFSVKNIQKNIVYNRILRPSQLIFIPEGHSYDWRSTDKRVTKILNWNVLPKKFLWSQINLLSRQDRIIKKRFPYNIDQIMIDYSFHEFSLIEFPHMKNSDLLNYNSAQLPNFLNKQFSRQNKIVLYQLQQDQFIEFNNGRNDFKIDQCSLCSKFIVNYFAFKQNKVICVDCIKKEVKKKPKIQIYRKISNQKFEKACQQLLGVQMYKTQSQKQDTNVKKMMELAYFFEYEDTCDQDFVGAHHTSNCGTRQINHKKVKNSNQQIFQNTINYLKSKLGVKDVLSLIEEYSSKNYKDIDEKNRFLEIMNRASCFMREQQRQKMLKRIFPSHKEDNLKIFALKLCIQNMN